MAKAYKSLPIDRQPYRADIEATKAREDVFLGEIVICPIDGCTVSYTLYNSILSDRRRNCADLALLLERDHPAHTVGYYRINEPTDSEQQ